MAIVEPGKGRAIIEQMGSGLRITIPARTQVFAVIFLPLWLVGWAVGEITATRELISGGHPANGGALFLTVWLTGRTLGGAWAGYVLLWQLAGKEVIELTSTTLRRRKQIPIFSRSREFAVATIKRMRPVPPIPSFYRGQEVMQALTFKGGAIAFDYGRDTHHLGAGLDEADADYVIAEMRKRVKSLSAKAEAA